MAAPLVGGMGLASTIGGGLLGMAGGIMGGSAQASQMKYQSAVAKINANIARQNAEWTIRSGETEAKQTGQKSQFVIGQQRAQQGASGIDVNRGPAVQVRDSQHDVGLEDQTTIRTNAGRKAYGFEVEAATQDANAKNYSTAASTAKTSGFINAGSSFLGSVGSVSSKWMQGNQIGLWGGSGGSSETIFGPSWHYSGSAV